MKLEMEVFNDAGEIKYTRLKSKKDRFKQDRGGSSEFLDLFCSSCNTYFATYQKDGPGNLFRLYIDRITTPYKDIVGPFSNTGNMSALKCRNPECQVEIGVPMLYDREKRLAYRITSSIHKRKNKRGTFPPVEVKKEDIFLEQ